ncbi:uncharacterized protein METZ01_LOCUS257647 [marine metagenome]|jgi:hypothetical protein|uniref:Uncharacterized protein n=1 Tax=marine metagenome TaxID=408172 RepID=A0A382J133_9ZZZZ|tara:strand:- start:194 stop:487 length:294 start_codon:yes stop_codon:yes gene_type:complete
MSDVKIVRLKTGEEILCEYRVSEHRKMTHIKNGLMIVPTEQSIGFIPFMVYADLPDNTFSVKSSHVLWVVDPVSDLVDRHQETFNTIVAPESKIIVP